MVTISPYLGGLLMGLFVVIHFILIGRGIGGSAGYICMVRKVFKSENLYYGKNLDPLKYIFALGIILGAFIHTLYFNGVYELTFDMQGYNDLLPENEMLKSLVLILGGMLLAIGARFAGGCTSGHALAGGALLNKNSLLLAMVFFIVAIVTSNSVIWMVS